MQRRGFLILILMALGASVATHLAAQDDNKWDNFKIDRSRGILRDAYDAVKKHYYDPKFHGIDLDARYREFDEKVRNAGSLGRAFGNRIVGNLFDHDVKIGDRVGRKESKPQMAKTRGGNVFTGKLIVLIDSESASASELLARLVQLEHRGTVIGDRSAGAVMEARHYPYEQGADVKFFYSFSVTEADLIMTDGKSLEHVGVIPHERSLPMGQDIASGADPVLAHAFELAGLTITPAEAGKLFPFEREPF